MRIRQLLLLLLLACSPAHADTSVWEISRDNQRLFIGGTIHILSEDDYPLPAAYDLAYRQAGHLVFETDIGYISSPEFSARLQELFTYKDGNSLKNNLKPETYRKLERYCEQAGIPIVMMLPLKPPLASMMLTILELQKIGITNAGVDHHFRLRATSDGKTIGKLETIEQQLQFLANMARGREDELILSTLEENRQLSRLMDTMLTAWRTGDHQQLEDSFIKPMKREFPGVYRELLVQRNRNWQPLIEQYLATPEVEFILVGALHLVGEDGLIQQLRRAGYRTRQW